MNRIHQYIKKNVRGQRQIVGVMIGEMDANKVVRLGWSKTATNKGDVFSKDVAFTIANNRLKATETIPIPHSINKDMIEFRGRCRRYFKNSSGLAFFTIQTT